MKLTNPKMGKLVQTQNGLTQLSPKEEVVTL